MRIRVRVAAGEDSETKLMKLAGISAVVHVVGVIVVSFLPRLLSSPPPPISMVAEIVPASSLLGPSQTPTGPPPPSGPTPSQRAAEARKAQQKPPAEKPPVKAPPKAVPKKDTTVPPLESKKMDPKKKEPEKPQPPAQETRAPEPSDEKPGADAEKDLPDDLPPAKDEPSGPAPGAGISFGSSAGFDASGVPTLGSSAFPYDYYRSTLMTLLQSNWRRPVVTDSLAEPLRCGIGFTILKSGVVKDAHVADPSGNPGLDRSALRAVIDSNPLPPLPFQYGHDAVSAVVYFKLTGD